MYDLDYYETALMLDPNFGGHGGSDNFLQDYWDRNQPAPDPADYQQWQIDAAVELFETVLQDPRINSVLDAYQNIPEPAEHVTNMVVNQTSQWMAENAEAGAYDDIFDQYNEMSDMADAWESANGFDDPFLDWHSFGETSFWRDDGPTWWGDEYGIY
ncbi:hypothetical protein [Tateyamaria omphalii]|uniref:Uncharacterized protein n=1 Tax=Tateyamaria omphalii TaxID=299262 RepID=A0A1P8MSD3_9RHOB|nr:hypothetical protein [Tateyamaria omphalii]APX10955.1 hypothetical protein BWR18_04060 [Tateyamaria omphalii]